MKTQEEAMWLHSWQMSSTVTSLHLLLKLVDTKRAFDVWAESRHGPGFGSSKTNPLSPTYSLERVFFF